MDPHTNNNHDDGHSHSHRSSSELLSSAKLVAQAAQSTFRHESHKVDKTKVAHAAGDLLEAACQYGKLEEKGIGKYVDKAEDYLHHYGGGGGGGGGHSAAGSHSAKPDQSNSHGDKHSGGGGYGDYLKMAQGLMKSESGGESHAPKTESHGHGDGHSGGGGYGDYLNMAEGFLKK